MLIGEYIHTIDEKNRVSMPAKFRKELGKKIIITPGLDNCLFVFKNSDWSNVVKNLTSKEGELSFLESDQRSFNRYMFGRAAEVELDSIGRILIPEFLKVKLKLSGSVAIVGVEDRLEIWNDKDWAKYKEDAEKNASNLAEKLASKKSK